MWFNIVTSQGLQELGNKPVLKVAKSTSSPPLEETTLDIGCGVMIIYLTVSKNYQSSKNLNNIDNI